MAEGGVDRTPIGIERRHPPDGRVATVAARQHGVIALLQLRRCGLTKREVGHRVAVGHLHPVHRGVYAVGHPGLTDPGRWLAAVLALGDEAVLSHHPAGTLIGFLPQSRNDHRPPIDVTVPRRLKPRDGIRPHVARGLRTSDVTRREAIPVTTAARTLLDLSATLRPVALQRAMNEALVLHHVNLQQLQEQLDRAQGIPTAAFRAALVDASPTRSGLEDEFLRRLRARGLPKPRTNKKVAGFEVDALYPDRNLVIEIDSAKYHRLPAAKRRDARKQHALEAAGYTVLRVPQDAMDEALDQLEEDHLGRV
jgi:very-short-patch-repair endonuclease/predicted transcriptional regulator of viral defense system